ncbi:MAG: pilus assembly protein PilM [Proteobacteria bacterium]|nr:pilus assembly protein PilM [Pseudomonadota bacterium]
MSALFSSLIRRLPWVSPALGPAPPIGLYLGPDRLDLVQMNGGAPACLRAMSSIALPEAREQLLGDPAGLRALLRQAFASEPFRGKTVVSCLPADQVKILSLSYVLADGQTDDQAVAVELRGRLQDELDEMVVDYMPLRRDEGDTAEREALVALAPRTQVMAYLHLLSDAGLKVAALDIGPAALTRCVKHTSARHFPGFPAMPNALLINFGAESSYLTVIWGRRTVLDRVIGFGESRLFERLKTVLDMPRELSLRILCRDEEASASKAEGRGIVEEVIKPDLNLLHQEISKTLVYMASRTRGKSIDALFLAGPVARYPIVVESLQQILKVPVHILNPAVDFAPPTGRRHDEALGTTAGMALAAGLALRGVPENE